MIASGTYIQWPPVASAILIQRSVSSGCGIDPRLPKSVRKPPTCRKTSVRTAIFPDHTLRTDVVCVGSPAYDPPTTQANSSGNHTGFFANQTVSYLPPVPTTSEAVKDCLKCRSQSR